MFISYFEICSSQLNCIYLTYDDTVLSQIDESEKEELEYKTVEEDQELV